MISRNVALCAAMAALLAACSTINTQIGQVRRNHTATGAAVGGFTGATLGYATNSNKSEQGRTNALIGAGIGALAGPGIGRYMDRQEAELQHHLAGSGVGVIRQGENIVLQMPGDTTFALDSAVIQPRFDPVLNDVAAVLNRYPATYVDIVGHASADGSDAHNQVLSEKRALAVGDYLLRQRVLRARLFVAGRGESEPIASNVTQQGRAQNRRVEIILRPHTTT